MESGCAGVGDAYSGVKTASATLCPCRFEMATSSSVTRQLPVCRDHVFFLPPCLLGCVGCAAQATLFVVTHGVIEFESAMFLECGEGGAGAESPRIFMGLLKLSGLAGWG